ncbi:MAG: hydantoinase/oxoprolinase family protein [Chloroflexi bacterium]|nr:hydantoinase/oxoprolinase family protein [Chloroflexota bacterium]
MRIGIDVGGTFTDVVLVDKTGKFYYTKTTTTHEDLAQGVLNGLEEILGISGRSVKELRYLIHGTTIGTNAIIEGKGAKAGLITTRGFEDVLEIRRVARPKEAAYDFEVDNPPPMIPRYLRKGVIERVNSKGQVTIPLDEDSVRKALAFLQQEGVQAIAVSLLFSFLNPSHERRIGEICKDMFPDMPVSLSSEICPEFREYERTCTTVMNAYLGPVVHEYLDNLMNRLREEYGDVKLHIMQSSAGSMPVDMAKNYPAQLINSGPAGGATATAFIARLVGRQQAVGVDMGGTTFDISLIDQGMPRTTTWGGVGEYPIKLPMVDMKTIGAGGGSIARVDALGVLHVGPESAGSEPGPACYNNGGELPTVTDANLVLGRLNADYFVGGKYKLYPEKARQAVKKHVAGPMGVSIEEAALGIIRIVNANMVKGISAVSVEKGYDLREFSLVSFGGACGLHVAEMAIELQMPVVICPPMCGLFSAVGLVVADVEHDYVKMLRKRQDQIEIQDLIAHFQRLEKTGGEQLKNDNVHAKDMDFLRSADMCYEGQSWELNVPIARPSASGSLKMEEILADFHKAHHQAYSYSNPGEKAIFVSLRLRAIGRNPIVEFPRYPLVPVPPSTASKEERTVWLENGPARIPIYERGRLGVGSAVNGPCLIEEDITTIFLPKGCLGSIDELKNMHITFETANP